MRDETPQHRRVDVYLTAGGCRGTLELADHQRLSDYLGSDREQITLDNATVGRLVGGTVAANRRVIIEKRHVLFVVELDDPLPATVSIMAMHRDRLPVMVGVGPYWIQGMAHVPPGGQVALLFSGSVAQFLPVTNARLTTQPEAEPRTVLINREHRHSLIV